MIIFWFISSLKLLSYTLFSLFYIAVLVFLFTGRRVSGIEAVSARDRWTRERLKLAKFSGRGEILEGWEEFLQNVRDSLFIDVKETEGQSGALASSGSL